MRRVILLVGFSLCPMPLAAELIVNGSFEDGDFLGCSNGSWCSLFGGSSVLTGWEIAGLAINWHNSVEMQFPHSGDKVVDLHLHGFAGEQGSISQNFATVPGQEYLLRFFLAGPGGNFGFPDPRSVVVNIADIQQTFSTPASSNLNIQWGGHQWIFKAEHSTTTLIFSSPHNGVGFWGPVLDDVSVTAVPEPSTAALLIAGLLGLAVGGKAKTPPGPGSLAL